MGDTTQAEAVSVAICIASHRRPEGLHRLLRSLDALVFEDGVPDVRVVVADNDAARSARTVCEEAQGWLRHALTYVVEARRGIPQARNASLAPVLTRVDWVAFVDDDEIVGPRWLDNLLRVQRATGADAVTGPVEPRFVEAPPEWVVAGGFFDQERFADGAPRPVAFTNNALVRASALVELGALFDETLRTGEDTELFARLHREGGQIVWANDACVVERVPPERARLASILGRGFREGLAQARVERCLGERGIGGGAVRGIGRIAQGLLSAASPWSPGLGARARGLRRVAFGIGRLVGAAERWRSRNGVRQ
jgi:cellulose synthase/poly-beta-1,6-N-acetylglucosamine synthase-like glycosyltransferase